MRGQRRAADPVCTASGSRALTYVPRSQRPDALHPQWHRAGGRGEGCHLQRRMGGVGQREVSEAECSDDKNLSALPTPLLTITQGPGAEGLRRM